MKIHSGVILTWQFWFMENMVDSGTRLKTVLLRAVPSLCSELGGDSEVSSQSSVIASGLWPSIFVDVLMAQLE